MPSEKLGNGGHLSRHRETRLILEPLHGDAIFRCERSRRVDSNSAPPGNAFEWKEEADDVVRYGASLHSTLTLWKRWQTKKDDASESVK